MSNKTKVKQVCVSCQKEFEGFRYSWRAFIASPRKERELLAYECASCSSAYCFDCRASTFNINFWHGWEQAKCPKCENSFGVGCVYFESDLSPEETQKAIKHLLGQLNYSVDKKAVPRQADALADLGEPGIEALLSQINPGGKNVTPIGFTEAARFLAKTGEPRAIKRFESVLGGDPKSKIVLTSYRVICAEHLAQIDPIGCAKLLGDILVNEKEPMDLRQKSAQLLGMLKRSESVMPLNQVLGDLKSSKAALVATAAEALGNIGDSRSFESLIAALNISNPEAKARVAEALGKLNDPRAVEPLKKSLATGHQGLREATARALKNLNWQPADKKEKLLQEMSLPVEKERFCFSCDKPVGDAKSCPNCQAELLSKPYSPAMASILGYLFGGLMGGIGLLIIIAIKAFFLESDVDMTTRMLVFAIFALGGWKGMKAKLSTPRDLAVLKPKQENIGVSH